MADDTRFIRRIKIRNLFSFSDTGIDLELGPLNVLIGPNGCGKSNFIETIRLIKSLPIDFAQAVRDCGGIDEILWKGTEKTPVAEIGVTVSHPEGTKDIFHGIMFTKAHDRMELKEEIIEDSKAENVREASYKYYVNDDKTNALKQKPSTVFTDLSSSDERATINFRHALVSTQSILNQIKIPDQFPEISYLSGLYEKIRLFTEWNMGRNAAARGPQKADGMGDYLNENFGNLSLVLNELTFKNETSGKIIEHLKTVYNRIKEINTKTQMGQIQTYINEGLSEWMPASRLSDGTLRYLCLLIILLHPSPPPLICLEEPELGLHPDIISELAKLLIDASNRTQLIVTTHSHLLIDALSDCPESVVVCDNNDGATEMKRLDKNDLSEWLEDYSLGDVWMKGAVGGTRW